MYALHVYYELQIPLLFKKKKDTNYSRFDWKTTTI